MRFKWWGGDRSRAQPATASRMAEGERVYAIGDVHGCLDLLDELLDKIAADDATRPGKNVTLVFLGDLIDRGPASKGVLDRVLALRKNDIPVRLLCGNHEEVFLRVLEGDAEALSFFNRIGGRETILSYGVEEETFRTAELDDLLAIVKARVPAEHYDLLKSCEDSWLIGDYLFVHAGIRPGVAIEDQQSADLRWIRREFLEHRGPHPWTVVHGHTPVHAVEALGHRINVDTGAYMRGRLTAVGLEDDRQWFLETETTDPV